MNKEAGQVGNRTRTGVRGGIQFQGRRRGRKENPLMGGNFVEYPLAISLWTCQKDWAAERAKSRGTITHGVKIGSAGVKPGVKRGSARRRKSRRDFAGRLFLTDKPGPSLSTHKMSKGETEASTKTTTPQSNVYKHYKGGRKRGIKPSARDSWCQLRVGDSSRGGRKTGECLRASKRPSGQGGDVEKKGITRGNEIQNQ